MVERKVLKHNIIGHYYRAHTVVNHNIISLYEKSPCFIDKREEIFIKPIIMNPIRQFIVQRSCIKRLKISISTFALMLTVKVNQCLVFDHVNNFYS